MTGDALFFCEVFDELEYFCPVSKDELSEAGLFF